MSIALAFTLELRKNKKTFYREDSKVASQIKSQKRVLWHENRPYTLQGSFRCHALIYHAINRKISTAPSRAVCFCRIIANLDSLTLCKRVAGSEISIHTFSGVRESDLKISYGREVLIHS